MAGALEAAGDLWNDRPILAVVVPGLNGRSDVPCMLPPLLGHLFMQVTEPVPPGTSLALSAHGLAPCPLLTMGPPNFLFIAITLGRMDGSS